MGNPDNEDDDKGSAHEPEHDAQQEDNGGKPVLVFIVFAVVVFTLILLKALGVFEAIRSALVATS